MFALFAPSLVPIVLLSWLFGLLALRAPSAGARGRGLAAWCFGTAGWALSLLLTAAEPTRALGERLLMLGFFTPAGFLYAVTAELGWDRRPLRLAYGVAVAMALSGAIKPDLYLHAAGTAAGPLFPLQMSLAAILSFYPLLKLLSALRHAPAGTAERCRYLLLGGALALGGGGLNVLLLLAGRPYPVGLYMALAAQALVAMVVQGMRLPTFGRFVERSLRYSLLAAGLSALWLWGVLLVARATPAAGPYAWGVGFLLFLLVLAGQPVLAWARGWVARAWFPGQGDLAGLTEALAESEARAEHAARLAELGTLASAVAHEVRNPLGVISGATRLLARQGADPALVHEIDAAVDRAARFADELLEYGRPAPPRLRPVDLSAAAAVAADEVRRALPLPQARVQVEGEAPAVQADLGQIVRLFGALLENAVLAAGEGGAVRLRIAPAGEGVVVRVEDSGPGVPEAIAPRIFSPFVSGRGRGGPRPGTGLGLSIAAGVVERHHGALAYEGRSAELGGACFRVTLPLEPPLPAGG